MSRIIKDSLLWLRSDSAPACLRPDENTIGGKAVFLIPAPLGRHFVPWLERQEKYENSSRPFACAVRSRRMWTRDSGVGKNFVSCQLSVVGVSRQECRPYDAKSSAVRFDSWLAGFVKYEERTQAGSGGRICISGF